MTYRIPAADDALRGDARLPDHVRVADFWRWAMSDLCDDYVKGFFAEWLVANLLGAQLHYRPWSANYDILHAGRTIEVKATSYWQTWRVVDEHGAPRRQCIPIRGLDKIGFRVSTTRRVADGSTEAGPATFKSDFYVFCFEHEQELESWNPLDLAQWEFYYLSREELQQLGRKAISVRTLRSIFEGRLGEKRGLTAREFQEEMARALNDAQRSGVTLPAPNTLGATAI